MKTLIKILLLSLLISSCSLEKRIMKAKLLAVEHPTKFADFCAATFPVVPTYIKGKDSTITETVFKRDTVTIIRTIDGKRDTIKVPCPPCEQKTKIVFRTDTVLKENTAKLEVSNQQLKKLEQDLSVEKTNRENAEKSAKHRLYYLIAALAAFGLIIYFKR